MFPQTYCVCDASCARIQHGQLNKTFVKLRGFFQVIRCFALTLLLLLFVSRFFFFSPEFKLPTDH